MKYDAMPFDIEKRGKPWLAHDCLSWPKIQIDSGGYTMALKTAIEGGGDKISIQARAIDFLAVFAWSKYLEKAKWRWSYAVRGTDKSGADIQWQDVDKSKNVMCCAYVEIDKEKRTAEVALTGWLHLGELLCLSAGQSCTSPFRPADSLLRFSKRV